MKKFSLLLILMVVPFSGLLGQGFMTPFHIASEMEMKECEYKGFEFQYKVVYPDNYDSTRKYPVYLALSGGHAYERIVDYCYYTTFRSWIIREDYITVLPLSPEEKSLNDFSRDQIVKLLSGIIKNENVTEDGWLIGGTSLGGKAAFLYASIRPKMFTGILAMPGNLEFDDIPPEWKGYHILLAYGSMESQDWIDLVIKTEIKLKGKVANIEKIVMEGQGHVLNPNYSINEIYRTYFGKEEE